MKFHRLLESAAEGGEGGSGGEVDNSAEEQRARDLGWVPEEEWQGPKEKWRAAAEFLARGEEVMPILKANNRRLHQQLSAQQQETQTLRQQLAEQQEILKALKETNDEIVKDRKQAQITELTTQIATAREANDVALESRLQARLTNLSREVEEEEEEEDEPKPRRADPPPQDFSQAPWWLEWREENAWYGADQDKTLIADAVAIRLRKDPANANIKEKPFMDKVTAEVARITGAARSPARSRVEGGGSRSGGGGGDEGSRYADLPADAKAACAKQAKKLVGDKPGQFKTEKDFQTYYARTYFGSAK
jgi:hypothetical protein